MVRSRPTPPVSTLCTPRVAPLSVWAVPGGGGGGGGKTPVAATVAWAGREELDGASHLYNDRHSSYGTARQTFQYVTTPQTIPCPMRASGKNHKFVSERQYSHRLCGLCITREIQEWPKITLSCRITSRHERKYLPGCLPRHFCRFWHSSSTGVSVWQLYLLILTETRYRFLPFPGLFLTGISRRYQCYRPTLASVFGKR